MSADPVSQTPRTLERELIAMELDRNELVSKVGRLAQIEIDKLTAKLESAERELQGAREVVSVIKNPGCWVFLDGRNEHGTHILSLPLGSVDWDKESAEHDYDFAGKVFKEAEALGFKAGDSIWLEYVWVPEQVGNFGMIELPGYYDYQRINTEVSRALKPAADGAAGKERAS